MTSGPGLAGALMVGVCAAKALAVATGKPLYAINHLVAHVGVGLLDDRATGRKQDLPENLGALLVSGGHTEILRINSITSDVELLGSTIDDAAGEAYDKVARILGLGYPGGPAIDKVARNGNPKAIRFPRGLTQPKYMGTADEPGPHRYDWSFSGLKTAVARCVEQFEARGEEIPVADIAAAFQEAVVDVISSKAVLACREHGIKDVLLGGGVAANSRLRELTGQRCASAGIRLHVPPLDLCTDNGAMVAALGAQLVMAGVGTQRDRLRPGLVDAGHLGVAPGLTPARNSCSIRYGSQTSGLRRRPSIVTWAGGGSGGGAVAHLLDQVQHHGLKVPAVAPRRRGAGAGTRHRGG